MGLKSYTALLFVQEYINTNDFIAIFSSSYIRQYDQTSGSAPFTRKWVLKQKKKKKRRIYKNCYWPQRLERKKERRNGFESIHRDSANSQKMFSFLDYLLQVQVQSNTAWLPLVSSLSDGVLSHDLRFCNSIAYPLQCSWPLPTHRHRLWGSRCLVVAEFGPFPAEYPLFHICNPGIILSRVSFELEIQFHDRIS